MSATAGVPIHVRAYPQAGHGEQYMAFINRCLDMPSSLGATAGTSDGDESTYDDVEELLEYQDQMAVYRSKMAGSLFMDQLCGLFFRAASNSDVLLIGSVRYPRVASWVSKNDNVQMSQEHLHLVKRFLFRKHPHPQ
jgi:hypothetical protein